ncbi:ribosome assembly RNA-binding protein YhbY [Natronospira bacteriovora]|uniref:Ribosome assembly RNA-binding protein YhbY n=1 Tax=Natronospira bacteriovora TaxID=3069753 RepID=A0ABU0W570_9GAMM|nr:ribosome assembly RNA-binding protein YhbY [Natronospira sp. AB-CW4]MDQ2069122.1 ribosome assembly RNA-binding protein YhbY [Natronospira sp. AB-CW4]
MSKPPKALNEAQRKHLKRLAHHRRPIVQTGANGLTDAVMVEIERGLNDHELIKVRLVANDREERGAMIAEICERTSATLVQRIGHVAVLYLPHPKKPVIELPGAPAARKTAHS